MNQPPPYGQPPQYPGQPSWEPPRPPKKKHRVRNILGALGGIVVLIIIIAVVAAGGSNKTSADSSSARSSASPSPTSTLNPEQQDFVNRATGQFDLNTSAAGALKIGNGICSKLSSGSSEGDVATTITQTNSGIDSYNANQMVSLAIEDLCPGDFQEPSPAFSPSAAPSPTPSQPSTVTFIVSGDADADVTYGPAGSDLTGSVPMDTTQTIPAEAPEYYAINAQLQGDGDVSCKIEVDGQVISTGQAEGGYNIADCEIGQDPITGSWQNDNG